MHPELVVYECSAQGDGIATNFGVKILESRLDMTKRARKALKYKELSHIFHGRLRRTSGSGTRASSKFSR